MNFGNIIGNDSVKNLLTNLVNTNNLVHSYMFIGTDGIGKLLFAKEFAKMILCENEVKSCNKCSSCIKFISNSHPDFLLVNSEDEKNIKINQIRLLQEKVSEKPILSNKKVYIIDNSDLMTTEAQNCLLKTLEEPPPYAIIILVLSNENKILNTIKSRCTKIAFQKLSKEELIEYSNLQNINIDSSLLSLCDGSISKLINIHNNMSIYTSLNDIIYGLSNQDIIDVWNRADLLYSSKENILSLLEYFNTCFFKKLKETNDTKFKYIKAIEIVENTKNRITNNANYDMCIDNLLLQIWEEFHEGNCRSKI